MSPAELRAFRKSLGMSQTELATALGLMRNTVSNYERGVTKAPAMYELALERLKRLRWKETSPDQADPDSSKTPT